MWVPDYEDPDQSLAGALSHPNYQLPITNYQFIGPLSRFSITNHQSPGASPRRNGESGLRREGQYTNRQSYDVVAVLSGLEPHRSLLEQDIIARYTNDKCQMTNDKCPSVLIVQGLMNRPNTRIKRGNITIVPSMTDAELVPALLGAKHIIARSGYSTLMDLDALGLLNHPSQMTNHQSPIIELIPTPGQPEQEYLAKRIEQKTLFS